jgi:hypothetical protein
VKNIVLQALCLLFVMALTGSCATVDQYGSRAYDGNVNTQNAFNKEVLANIIRASKYEALSWNPPSQITGSQMESLTTGLPTVNIGPTQTTAQGIYSISNSLASSVNGGFSTAPLATTGFQTGMLTPVDLKTMAALTTYYPREVVFYALIGAITLTSNSVPAQYARLLNDPGQSYYNLDDPSNLSQNGCDRILGGGDNFELLFHRGAPKDRQCSYAKFANLLNLLIANGLNLELVQAPAQQPAQAQANQSNIVTIGRLCFDKSRTGNYGINDVDLPSCGLDRRQSAGGTIVTAQTETNKADDEAIRTNTKSITTTITTTRTSILPITGHNFSMNFQGVGKVYVTFELRSPNGFLSYLGSWYKAIGRIDFDSYVASMKTRRLNYHSIQAQEIFNGGPYLSIMKVNGPSVSCYASVNYEGQTYCVPQGATHTSMLMDVAIMLRNLNITPADLNAPVSVRVAD